MCEKINIFYLDSNSVAESIIIIGGGNTRKSCAIATGRNMFLVENDKMKAS